MNGTLNLGEGGIMSKDKKLIQLIENNKKNKLQKMTKLCYSLRRETIQIP